jgi:hypothetical protein
MSACDSNRKNDSASTNTNTKEAYNGDSDAESMEADGNAWMRERDDFVARNREIGTRIDRDIESYEGRMSTMDAKSRKAMQESINSLRVKRRNLDSKLSDLENSTQETWSDMKQGVSDAGTELESTWGAFDKQYNKNNNSRK